MTGESPRPKPRAFGHAALALALAAVLVLLQALGPEAVQSLRWEPDALSHGEGWRLVTGNLVHLGWAHLGWNLAGLALVWVFCGPDLSLRAWILTLALTSIGTGLGLSLGDPGLDWYVGFSGVLHGLFITGAAVRLQEKHWDGALVMGLVVLKIVYEQWIGPTPGVEQAVGGRVVVDAHLYGALSGAVAAIVLRITGASSESPSN